MTIAVLRSLHAIIGEAIDDIERVYTSQTTHFGASTKRQTPENLSPRQDDRVGKGSITYVPAHKTTGSNSQAYASPPPSPSIATSSSSGLPSPITSEDSSESVFYVDFPSLDVPCDQTSLSEKLTTHPVVLSAIGKIVAAAGQMTATVQIPFLSLCEATMGYHLQSCMRMLEASHVVEIIREAGSEGVHVQEISEKNGVTASKLAHILRLLATHHLLREVSPDVFALNRLSSLVDSGKAFSQLKQFEAEGRPEMKYRDTNGISAFVGLCTDEIQKSAAYMTETYYLSPSQQTREGRDPARAPFCFALDTAKTGTGYFGWLEGEVSVKTSQFNRSDDESIEIGRGASFVPTSVEPSPKHRKQHSVLGSHPTKNHASPTSTDSESSGTVKGRDTAGSANANRFRLERFGKAMSGTDGWETPGAVLNGFDWGALPTGSIIVDVGGGIGSTSMLLATAFSSPGSEEGLKLKFIIQDRPVVCEMGEKAWREKCPKLLESTAQFQVHDFFMPQPVRNAAVFLLRVVLHDWPDDFARKILLHLRDAATSDTKLVIADFVLPLACPDDMGSTGGLEDVEGAESILAPSPLLPNLGKASANVYYMDLTMQVMFNAQERTLREMVVLALSAGWKVIKVTKTAGSLFGNMVAIPVAIPAQQTTAEDAVFYYKKDAAGSLKLKSETEFDDDIPPKAQKQRKYREELEIFERASSRCGTPTFGSSTTLSSVDEALARFGGGLMRSNGTGSVSSPHSYTGKPALPPLKPALLLSSTMKRKSKPSPLSVPPLHSSPTPTQSPRRFPSTSPRHENSTFMSPGSVSTPRILTRRTSLANLRPNPQHSPAMPPPPLPSMRQPPPSPLSPRHPPARTISRRASLAQLRSDSQNHGPVPPLPSFIPVRASAEPSSPNPPFHSGASPGSSMSGSRQSVRRASTAQLPQGSLWKRSGTVTVGASASEAWLDPGVVLRFDADNLKRGHTRKLSDASALHISGPGSVNVLAAAARIDRGDFHHRPNSPS